MAYWHGHGHVRSQRGGRPLGAQVSIGQHAGGLAGTESDTVTNMVRWERLVLEDDLELGRGRRVKGDEEDVQIDRERVDRDHFLGPAADDARQRRIHKLVQAGPRPLVRVVKVAVDAPGGWAQGRG